MSSETRRLTRQPRGLLCPEEPFRLELRVPPTSNDHALVIELFDAANPTHPSGHYGCWKFEPDGREAYTLRVDPKGAEPIQLDAPPDEAWQNPELDLAAAERVQLHVKLEHRETRGARLHFEIPWARDPRVLDDAKRLLEAPRYVRELAAPSIPLPEGARVHVAATDIRSGDAVGNLALDAARALRLHGYDVQLWAKHIGAELWGVGRSLDLLAEHARPGDLIFHQYSIHDPDLGAILACPAAKLSFYHGVTPPHHLAGVDESTEEACRMGIAELPRLGGFDALAAATSFTADPLRSVTGADVRIVPPTLNLGRFDALDAAPVALPDSGRFLLFVGRLAPHKGLALLIEAFAAYAPRDPKCDLVLAGVPGGEDVAARRAALPPEIAARVHVVEGSSDAQLKTLYQTCTAYVSASEHEGFCVPLAEAVGFGKPVFAFDTPAVRETLGGAGRLFDERDPHALAALLGRVLHDPAALEAQLEGQRRRWQEIRRAANGQLLWDALAEAVSRAARPS